jgi:hypothetical protein
MAGSRPMCTCGVLTSTKLIEELKSSYNSSVGAGMRRGNSNGLSKSENMKEFNRLCYRQFVLFEESVDGIFDQLRLVKNIEMLGEKSQVTVAELLLKLEKLTIEIHEMLWMIETVHANHS